MNFEDIAKQAKNASLEMAELTTEIKNQALLNIADAIEKNKEKIFEANKTDLEQAQDNVSPSVFNRLKLDENKMRDMIQGVRDIANLDDPIGKNLFVRELDDGLTLSKVSCPIGVLGIIFEARPDVISQISSLAIKSSNAVILKGGKESKNTNKKILEVINEALSQVPEFPKNVVQQVFSQITIIVPRQTAFLMFLIPQR